jgi:hypothetical protein
VAEPDILISPLGRQILVRVAAAARAAAAGGDGPRRGRPRSEFALAAALRREYPADLVAAAMAQHELRAAAEVKFSRAAEMLFTRGGYEQSSSEMIARHRAARFAGARRIADLCCGIGGDLIALASVVAAGEVPTAGEVLAGGEATAGEVLAVDRDETHARLALHNAGVYGVGDRVRACVADVRDVPLTGFDAVFIDPARRADARGGTGGGSGRFRAGVSEPPLEWCFALARRVPAVCVKAAPGLPADLIPPGWEAEFIADGRDLKEAVLWSPAMATAPSTGFAGSAGPSGGPPDPGTGPRQATILPGGHTLVAVPGGPVPVAAPGEYLLDPNPAVTRAGLVEDLARTVGGWKIDDQIAFITVNREISTPFARTLRVLDSAPWNEKRFAARLRELGVGAVDIRRRGLAGDVDQIRRRLKLSGSRRATVVLTRADDRPWGLICAGLSLPAQQDAPHERGLAGVLHTVVDDADQAYPERYRRRPVPVHHPLEVGVRDGGHVLNGLFVRGLVVLGQQGGNGANRGRHGGDLRAGVAVAGLQGVFRQAETSRPSSGFPHLRHAERGRDVIVLDSRQVPDQPADRIRVSVGPVGELRGRQAVGHAGHRLADPAEGVDQQVGTVHGILL